MRLSSKYNPKAGIADFWSEFRRPNPYRWPILAVSACMSFGLFWLIGHQEMRGPPARPDVTYISTFAEGRSDAEIIAGNEANQAEQDELRANSEARAERRRDLYRTLGRATGVDVDAMEADLAAQEAADAAAAQDVDAAEDVGAADSAGAGDPPQIESGDDS